MGRPGGMKQRALALMLCAGMTVTMAPVIAVSDGTGG